MLNISITYLLLALQPLQAFKNTVREKKENQLRQEDTDTAAEKPPLEAFSSDRDGLALFMFTTKRPHRCPFTERRSLHKPEILSYVQNTSR